MVCHQVLNVYKTNKAPLAMLRMQGYTVAIYIDEIIAIDQSFEECLLTVAETINLFQKLGFVIHPDKSKLIPAKVVEYSNETKIGNKRIC